MMATLEDIQDGVLEKLHSGEEVDRGAVLAQNPDHRDSLDAFFDLLELIEAEPGLHGSLPASLGEFRIRGEIGRGGMGVVYEAEQPSLKRRVALKVLPPALRADARLLQRFQREAEAAGRLRHPGIVPVYSVGEAAGTPFFAMELVEGRSLDTVIRHLREGAAVGVPDDPEERRAWAVETIARVADALAYAHAEGILHRDVKPANILLEEDGTPRLTDFGLALDLHAPGLTRAGEVFGSPQYMSPEQAVRREAPLDARTDVYSLGVTLYELLTLRLPYDATTGPQLLTALAGGHVVPARVADPDIPPALALVLMRALRKDPDERYATATDFVEDLRAAMEGRETVAAAMEPRCRSWWRQPRTWVAALSLGAMGLLASTCLARHDAVDEVVEDLGVAHVLDYDELEALAEGTQPDGERLLHRSVGFSEEMRGVVARTHLSTRYQVKLAMGLVHDGALSRRVVVNVQFEAQVDGGDWFPVDRTHIALGPTEGSASNSVSKFSLAASPDWARVIGDHAGGASFTLRHRAVVQVAPVPDGEQSSSDPIPGGTSIRWTGEERLVLIYDSYPDDYPQVVTDPDLDARMRAILTPSAVQFVKVTGARQLNLMLRYEDARVPENCAFEVEVRRASDGRLVGTGKHTIEAQRRRPGLPELDSHRLISGLLVDFPRASESAGAAAGAAGGDAEEAELLLALAEGKVKALRLIFRPSRTVALDEPSFDRYWGGSLEVDVPVKTSAEMLDD